MKIADKELKRTGALALGVVLATSLVGSCSSSDTEKVVENVQTRQEYSSSFHQNLTEEGFVKDAEEGTNVDFYVIRESSEYKNLSQRPREGGNRPDFTAETMMYFKEHGVDVEVAERYNAPFSAEDIIHFQSDGMLSEIANAYLPFTGANKYLPRGLWERKVTSSDLEYHSKHLPQGKTMSLAYQVGFFGKGPIDQICDEVRTE